MKEKILIIDDDINLTKVLSYQLEKQGYQVSVANRGKDGLERFKKLSPEVVLLDIQMPDLSGIKVLEEIRRLDQQVVVIMITAYGSVENALEACRLGANDYITKPFGQEQLFFVIEKALQVQKLEQENSQLRQELVSKYRFENMVAKSSRMEDVLRMVGQVAQSDATVLILGESGTGKELIARAIHYNSPRKEKPLITVNCPSIPENLLESELFGHVKGAFTGAVKDRKGKFELADGGTIFLDEIGDLPESLQAKLLRVLQEQEFERLGDSQVIKVDVRVIAATNKDLFKQVQEGKFREDLYYRLSVVPIVLPPLRDRKEEIPYLVDFFLQRYGKGKQFTITPEALEALQSYDWPGNIRELENAIERAVILANENQITLQSLPPHVTGALPQPTIARDVFSEMEDLSLELLEKRAITEALRRSGGNQTRAAQLLNIPRHVLLYRMKKLGVDPAKL
ncbi:MAG: sigma-54-dependent Fis family transcriptional regulator [Calditrichaeota bacterium]|nr:MAG: sigma-54-dependent Fis family transcriptional regulator [Calditrichota bacterium]